jgi:hypothetical protein
LQALRHQFSDGRDPEAFIGISGAFMATQAAHPGDNLVLITICWRSLFDAMKSTASPPMDDRT